MTEILDASTLPLTGRHLIEASAGTGKTYNITRLYLRLLLEQGLRVDNILVMTFTRAATAELKGRIRKVLVETLAGWGQATDDAFFTALHAQLPAAQATALLRLALLQLDEAAIYTIHGFCKRALTQQAFNSGISFHADMEAETRTLMLEAVQDWYRQCSRQPDFDELHACWDSPDEFFRDWADTISHSDTVHAPPEPAVEAAWQQCRLAWEDEAPQFTRLNVRSRRTPDKIAEAQQAMDMLAQWLSEDWNPLRAGNIRTQVPIKDYMNTANKQSSMPALHAVLELVGVFERAHRAQWALRGIEYARQHVAAAKDQLDQLDFNDLIRRLRERLKDLASGGTLAAALAQKYPAALVDEFQDTDTDQYAILQAIYGDAGEHERLLCMIGDPKQAIYGFRGGDVFAYLEAGREADYRWQMDANFRSTQAVITGYNRMFYGAPLSAPLARDVFRFGIDYHPVRAGIPELRGLDDPERSGDFHCCLLPSIDDMPGREKRGPGYTKGGLLPLAQWCAAEITRLLAEARLDERALRPADIALLVRNRHEAAVLQGALRAVKLEAVYLSGQENVLTSPEADGLYRALNGILHLEDSRLLVAALGTPWLGYDAGQLLALQSDEHAWAAAADQVAEWRRVWQQQGFMKMALGLYQQRLHPEPQRHDRTLTNALHLLELLQEASQRHRQPQALLHWFAETRAELDERARNEAQQMRLEADGDLIRIATLHGAKGLEYPVVFLPFVSHGRTGKQRPKVIRYHSRDNYSVHRALEPGDTELALHAEEETAENIRLLYVGATRAARRLYLLAAEFSSLKSSPLAACLGVNSWADLSRAIDDMATEGTCVVHRIDHIPSARDNTTATEAEAAPRAAQFSGRIERDWWLSSFSALTRNRRHGGLSSRDRDSESANDFGIDADRSGELRFRLKPGAETGTLLHDVLEHLDFQQPELEVAIAQAERRFTPLVRDEPLWREQLTEWLRHQLEARLPSGARLADLPRAHTLREAEFYFPMDSQMQRGALGRILATHRGSAVPDLPTPAQLKGMMHGFIDLVYHWQGRYFVVDYKSSHLGNRLADYRMAALTENVWQNYYDLQYLLYSLALHRYLATRIPDYDPARHLGGVEYLYLRGMHHDHDTGIYHRAADLDALLALDAYFRGQECAA